jgi:signal transduction histidine kinase
LRPLLDDACKLATDKGISCNVECPNDFFIDADSIKLSECFDELIANSIHWFDKPNKKIKIKAIVPAPEPLPEALDRKKNYILIRVIDNGCGIPDTNKEKIFNAFFSTYQHGTGLGLALVRRIIEGHNGEILESGIFGLGADFGIYLPIYGNSENLEKRSD